MEHRNEKQKQRHSRWSAVDTVILLLVLLAIAGIVYRVVMTVRDEKAEEIQTTYEVYFEVMETHEDILAEIRGFDAVYLLENGERLGYIGVYKDGVTGENRVALTPTPVVSEEGMNRVTALGCMICAGSTLEDGSLAIPGSDRHLTPGSEMELRTDRAILKVRVTGIRSHS